MQVTGTARIGRAGALVWLVIALVTTPVFALRPPDGGGEQPHSEPPAGQQPPVRDIEKAPETGTAPRLLKRPAAPGLSADSFTPSERIKADSAVSFPVDI